MRPLAAVAALLLSPFMPLLFMGEEYGERAPFQYFCDHDEPELAKAVRAGAPARVRTLRRLRAGELPDPLAAETFTRSKLRRERDAQIGALYSELLRARRELPRGDAGEIAFDERARWLRVQRGEWQLVCSFAERPALVPCAASALRLATGDAQLEDGGYDWRALSGALVR